MLLRPNFSPADTGSLPHCRKKRTEVTLGKSYTRGFTVQDFVRIPVSLKKRLTQ